MRNAVVQIVEAHPEFTLVQIKAELQNRLPHKPRVSIQTISVSLCNELIVLKMETTEVDRNRHDMKYQELSTQNGTGT